MWVYEESVDVGEGHQELLSKVINETHENVKYLPGIQLPENVVAVPDLATACQDATLLIFVVPHQFLPSLLPTIKQSVHFGARGVSLIKGLGKFLYERGVLSMGLEANVATTCVLTRYLLHAFDHLRIRSYYAYTDSDFAHD